MAALFVDNGALLVHYVIVLEQALTNAEVVLFDLALCTFDAVVYHLGLNHLAVLKAELVHYTGNSFRGEQTHEVVFE